MQTEFGSDEVQKQSRPLESWLNYAINNPITPAHYGGAKNTYEAIKVIEAWGLNFSLGNVVKYISRAGKKENTTALQDLLKAKKYLEFEINKLENN